MIYDPETNDCRKRKKKGKKQAGGVFVQLSKKNLDYLYEVRRKQDNSACGANVLNSMGLDFDIIEKMRSGKKSGKSEKQMLETLKEFMNRVRKDGRRDRIIYDNYYDLEWIYSPWFSIPDNLENRSDWSGWNEDEKKK